MVPAITARDEKIATVRPDTATTALRATGRRVSVGTTGGERNGTGRAGTTPAATRATAGTGPHAATRGPGPDPVPDAARTPGTGRAARPAGPGAVTGTGTAAGPRSIVRAADPAGRTPDVATTGPRSANVTPDLVATDAATPQEVAGAVID